MANADFTYREFYDVPRAMVVHRGADTLFLDCPFDYSADDYPDHYDVYRLPKDTAKDLDSRSWEHLDQVGEWIAKIPIADVKFDPSMRAYIDDEVLSLIGL